MNEECCKLTKKCTQNILDSIKAWLELKETWLSIGHMK